MRCPACLGAGLMFFIHASSISRKGETKNELTLRKMDGAFGSAAASLGI